MSFDESQYRDQLYTELQSRILVNVPRLTGSLSILGSSVIVYIILKDRKHKLRRVYHRILLAYSLFDILCSFNYALSAAVVPKNTPGVWGATGNMATCEASGFVTHFTFASGLYGAFICIYYVLVLRYKISEETLARRVEPVVHFVAIAVPLVLGSIMLYKDMYNPTNIFIGWCFINCYPMDCLRRDDVECLRGENYEVWVFLHNVPFVGFFLSVVVSCVLTFLEIRKSEKRGARWAFSRQQSRIRMRESATQALLYIAAYAVTYLSFGIAGLVGPQPATEENRTFYFPMVLSAKFFLPLQGFWNCYIYIRPRYNAIRRRHAELAWYDVLHIVITANEAQADMMRSARRVQHIQNSNRRLQMGTEATEPRSRTRPAESNNDNKDSFNPELVASEYFLAAGSLHPLSNLEDQLEATETPSRLRHGESRSESDDFLNTELVPSEYFLTAGSLNPIFTGEAKPDMSSDSEEKSIHHTKAAARNSILALPAYPENDNEISSEEITFYRASSPSPSISIPARVSPMARQDHQLDESSEEIIFHSSQGTSHSCGGSQDTYNIWNQTVTKHDTDIWPVSETSQPRTEPAG